MTTTQFQTPESQIDTPESQPAPTDAFGAGASIYRRLDRGRRQPKFVKLAPAVALGVLALGGVAAYLALSHPWRHAAPAQVAQVAPTAAAPMPATAPAPAPMAAASPPAAATPPKLHVTHAAPAPPRRYAAATPRHARARSRAASATESGANASATVTASPPPAPAIAPSAPPAAPPVIQAPPETGPAPSSQT